ncbi:hypothetical protein GCM10027402_30110 [Arthrobacter monumenti]
MPSKQAGLFRKPNLQRNNFRHSPTVEKPHIDAGSPYSRIPRPRKSPMKAAQPLESLSWTDTSSYARASPNEQDTGCAAHVLAALGVPANLVRLPMGCPGQTANGQDVESVAACRASDTSVIAKLDRLG